MHGSQVIFQLIVGLVILLACWFIAERFSPDPLITKLVQLALFLVALYLVVTKVLPLVGIG